MAKQTRMFPAAVTKMTKQKRNETKVCLTSTEGVTRGHSWEGERRTYWWWEGIGTTWFELRSNDHPNSEQWTSCFFRWRSKSVCSKKNQQDFSKGREKSFFVFFYQCYVEFPMSIFDPHWSNDWQGSSAIIYRYASTAKRIREISSQIRQFVVVDRTSIEESVYIISSSVPSLFSSLLSAVFAWSLTTSNSRDDEHLARFLHPHRLSLVR